MNGESFNPLAIESLAESIVQRLLLNDAVPLENIPSFPGAGVYALFYIGDFPAYKLVRDQNINGQWKLPIYVGKAVPQGGRRGINPDASLTSQALWKRLADHTKSIGAAENLNIKDFYAKWLILEDIWIALGESALIRDTKPVWNAMVDGFGNHDPGKGRHSGLAPQWDTLHPGRAWAARLVQRPENAAELIASDAAQYLASRHG